MSQAEDEIANLRETLPEFSLREMVCTCESWLQASAASFVIGAGYTISTNLNQICESAYDAADASLCVTLFSVGNAV